MKVVPSMRLVWWVVGVAAMAALAGPLAELRAIWVLAAVLLAAVVAADLVWALWKANVPEAAIPAVVRLTKDRVGVVTLTLSNPGEQAQRVRLGLGWPAGFDVEKEDVAVELPAGAKRARVELTCTPRRRGRFGGMVAAVEGRSVLGFWMLRARTVLAGEVRVYPNLFSERRQVAALFLARAQQGALARRVVGRGREFEKLRDYLPGDGFDEIHWKATGKRGRPVTKVFQVERTQEIYVVLDVSRLSARPVVLDGVEQTALERCLTASLVLLLAAERMGDRFGLVAHDDRVRLFLRAGRGEGHYAACREAVLNLASSEATPDLAEIVRHLRTNLRQRALLFFLTDLTDPVLAEDFAKHVRVLSRQHLVLVSQLRVPGVARVFEGEDVKDDGEVYARLAGHERWSEAKALAQKLKPLGVTAAMLENETMAAELVTQYLEVKRRQVL